MSEHCELFYSLLHLRTVDLTKGVTLKIIARQQILSAYEQMYTQDTNDETYYRKLPAKMIMEQEEVTIAHNCIFCLPSGV